MTANLRWLEVHRSPQHTEASVKHSISPGKPNFINILVRQSRHVHIWQECGI